jgi:hypothetical protein
MIEFEYTVTEYGGRRVPTRFRYWPTFGSCQISQQYSEFTSAFKVKTKWTDWRWLTHTCERNRYMSHPKFIEHIS